MQRSGGATLSVFLGALVIILAVALAYKGMATPSPRGADDAGAVATSDARDAGRPDSAAEVTGGRESFGDSGMFLSDLQAGVTPGMVDLRVDGGVGFRMSDGTAVPPLPDKSPRSVRCGVVLVSYQGAQGAAPNARSKEAARELADKLAADAKTDFHGAVQRGDAGSSGDIGKIPRGILEPAPEYVLFTLAPGTVSDPVETPRGYWIVKRIE